MNGATELETFGRRLGQAQGFTGTETVNWAAYGQAARRALGRGVAIPLVATFLQDEVSSEPQAEPQDRWRPLKPEPRPRRILSAAWTGRVLYGVTWRAVFLLVVLVLATRGFVPTISELGIGVVILVVPGFWRPWRSVWRWLAIGLILGEVLSATDWYGTATLASLALTIPAAILAARRWRLRFWPT